MFPTKELIDYRKKEAARLQLEIKSKLLKVQKLVIAKIEHGVNVVFEISSYSGCAMIHQINGIQCGHKYYEVRLRHFDHMDYDYDNQICEFYQSQLEIVDYWITMLSK